MAEDVPNEPKGRESSTAEEPVITASAHLLLISVLSGIAYVVGAWLLFRFFHQAPLSHAFAADLPVLYQAATGVLFGFAAAAVIMFIFSFEPLRSVLNDFAIFRFLAEAKFTVFDRAQISVVAGIGEEILFRGAVQPLIGIWWTSLLFVALHGYLGFRSPAHFGFGVAMFGLSVGLGLLFEHVGLLAAIVGHAVYDFVMLEAVQRWRIFDRKT